MKIVEYRQDKTWKSEEKGQNKQEIGNYAGKMAIPESMKKWVSFR